jgi:hypothetical protein
MTAGLVDAAAGLVDAAAGLVDAATGLVDAAARLVDAAAGWLILSLKRSLRLINNLSFIYESLSDLIL